MKTSLTGALALTFLATSAHAFNGCYINDNGEPYESNLDAESGYDIVDVYLDDSFTGAASINGLPEAVAYGLVRQTIDNFHADGGPSFEFRYAGVVTSWDCSEPTYNDNQFIAIAASQDIGVACDDGSAVACAAGYEDWTLGEADLSCGWVKFDIGNERPLTNERFRETLLHELGHVIGWGHSDDIDSCPASFADDDSIMIASGFAGYSLYPAADKLVLQTDYGPGSYQGIHWRRKASGSTWSTATSIGTGGVAFGPVGASDAEIHAQGTAYRYLPGSGAQTRAIATVYDETGGWVTGNPGSAGATYHIPDIALAANRPNGGASTWGLAVLTGDDTQSDSADLAFFEKPLTGGSWTHRGGDVFVGRNHYLSCTYDPRTDRFVCLTFNSAETMIVETRHPGETSWVDSSFAADQTHPFALGADIACSVSVATTVPSYNCIAVGLQDPSSTYSSQVIWRLFYVNANGTVAMSNAVDSFYGAYVPPKVSANPLGSNPWFMIARTSTDYASWSDTKFLRLERNYDVNVYGSTEALDDSPVLSIPSGFGAHVYSGVEYEDLIYGSED